MNQYTCTKKGLAGKTAYVYLKSYKSIKENIQINIRMNTF